MKKSLLLLALLSLLFTSCFNSVFYNITQDVPPEKATVSGIINSIARYTIEDQEFLVLAADGGIRYKSANTEKKSEWYTYKNLPFELHHFDFSATEHQGEYIIKVLSDDSYIYILSTTYYQNEDLQLSCPDIVSIYSKKISLNEDGLWNEEGEWNKVISGKDYFKFSIEDDYVYSDFNVFSTNSVQKAHRKAFIRLGNTESYTKGYRTPKYFELKGDSYSEYTPEELSGEKAEKNFDSVVYFNGKYMFINSVASITDETLNEEAKYIYYGVHKTLKYYSVAGGVKTAIKNCGSPISCLTPCSNALLIGRADFSDDIDYTTGGIIKTSLTKGVPGSKLEDFTTNAHIQLSESYYILCLLNAIPGKPELESTFYASVAFIGAGSNSTAGVNYDNIGLWSYYPSRGNWNRE